MLAFHKNLQVKGLGGRCLRLPPLLGFCLGRKAAWYCRGSGHGTTRNKPVQERQCKMCITVLPYTSTEYESTFNVYWSGVGAAGLSCTELSIWEFPFFRGACRQGGGNSIWYFMIGMPQKDTLENVEYTIAISHFSFYCYSRYLSRWLLLHMLST